MENGGGSFLSEYGKTLIKTYENIVDIQKNLEQISKNVDFDSGKYNKFRKVNNANKC